MSQDKRRSHRFPIRQLVDISPNKENFFQATGINISETGFYCQLEEPIDAYSRVYIMLEIPDEDPVELEGIVVRYEKKGKQHFAAIEFSDLDDYMLTGIKHFIKTVAKS
ncbi:MAG: PilZ domain-containing protein [Leptospirales bacterium]